jgi:protein-S-isoprenylcysteine O-methyltransferase Ste14
MDSLKDTAGVVAPPPLIDLAAVVLGLLLDWLFPAYVLDVLFSRHERIVTGVFVMLAGGGLAAMALLTMRAAGTDPEPWKPSAQLVTGGIFRFLRNPIYVGGWIVMAGLGIALASDWMLVMLILSLPLKHFGVVLREERYLERRFGDEYRAYKQAVSRYGWPF